MDQDGWIWAAKGWVKKTKSYWASYHFHIIQKLRASKHIDHIYMWYTVKKSNRMIKKKKKNSRQYLFTCNAKTGEQNQGRSIKGMATAWSIIYMLRWVAGSPIFVLLLYFTTYMQVTSKLYSWKFKNADDMN